MASVDGPLRRSGNGLLLAVRVQPGASANRVDGIVGGADNTLRVSVKVTAAPDKGEANKAVIRLLAKTWKVPASRIEIAAGATQRNKTLLLKDEADAMLTRLQEWLKTMTSEVSLPR